jgi:hypothetical protein
MRERFAGTDASIARHERKERRMAEPKTSESETPSAAEETLPSAADLDKMVEMDR